MSSTPLFLPAQALRRRVDVGPRDTPLDAAVRYDWPTLPRDELLRTTTSARPWRRVQLNCIAGLGKSANLAWLEAAMAAGDRTEQTPVRLRLTDDAVLAALGAVVADPDALLGVYLGPHEAAAAPLSPAQRAARTVRLARVRDEGRFTLLLDGLDEALGRAGLYDLLHGLLALSAWRTCPVWVAGRPFAFNSPELAALFPPADWEVVRVEPLGDDAVRDFFRHYTGRDYWPVIPAEGRHLCRNPRLLRLVCSILADDPGTAGRLRTAADVYHLAYLEPGRYVENPADPGDRLHRRGLVAQGLIGPARQIMLADEERPNEMIYPEQVEYAAAVLGATAFQMSADATDAGRPMTARVPEGFALNLFRRAVGDRLLRADCRSRGSFDTDFHRLTTTGNATVDFLVFDDVDEERGVRFHDATVQAFFAAYWAVYHAADADLAGPVARWRAGGTGDRPAEGYAEFWSFAARMPFGRGGGCRNRWHDLFRDAFDPPAPGRPADPLRHERAVLAYPTMAAYFPDVVARWREPLRRLADPAAPGHAVWRALADGFLPVPGTDAALHRHAVTNAAYELFDPGHAALRWHDAGNRDAVAIAPDRVHPLVDAGAIRDDAACPVVNVSWYDARAFALWLGCDLPDEAVWQQACAGGLDGDWCLPARAKLADVAWFDGLPRRFRLTAGGLEALAGDDGVPRAVVTALAALTGEELDRGKFQAAVEALLLPVLPPTDERERERLLARVQAEARLTRGSTHPVGAKPANPFGFHDLHGNVWEWCLDRDGEPSGGGDYRVVRGGAWHLPAVRCKTRYRGRAESRERGPALGFRLAQVGPRPAWWGA